MLSITYVLLNQWLWKISKFVHIILSIKIYQIENFFLHNPICARFEEKIIAWVQIHYGGIVKLMCL